jgi:hypothetical protein|tara:strand:+ start:1734 stop:1994 length:261 start_codon:yes stop_codon:yes gene_type:complete
MTRVKPVTKNILSNPIYVERYATQKQACARNFYRFLVGIFSIFNDYTSSNEMDINHTLVSSSLNKTNFILGLFQFNLLEERYYENL